MVILLTYPPRRIELADGIGGGTRGFAAAGIRGVEVARRIERQAEWSVQIRGDIALVNTRRIELADGAGVGPISGVEIA